MKKTLCITAMWLLSVISLMAENTAIAGIWSTLTIGREMDYYKFTEDNKCSHWVTVASSETLAIDPAVSKIYKLNKKKKTEIML